MVVDVAPSQRSLTPQQAITVQVKATGGQTASTRGGFAADATAGAFTAGTNTRIWQNGVGISHSSSSARSWSFGYTAASTPGLVQMFAVVNTVDGNGRNNNADHWAFHEFDTIQGGSTPVRMFVNAPGVTPRGTSCVGSFRNTPVLGSKTVPTVGNQSFAFEVHGTAPSAPAVLLLGAPLAAPLDLSAIGITGCNLYIQSAFSLNGVASAGNAQRGDGVINLPLPIPNDPSLRFGRFSTQVAIVDVQASRPLAITMTNALDIAIP